MNGNGKTLVMDNSQNGSPSTQVSLDTPSSTPQNASAFERWRQRAMVMTGLGGPKETEIETVMRDCEKRKSHLMNSSPSIVFMLKHLKLSGCEVPPPNILCAPCGQLSSGGFVPEPGAVILCAGKFMHDQHMESTITHELIHMYDHCRFKVDWQNLRHHACSEIRANNLSRDCIFTRELQRGIVGFSKQHQNCVRTRAIVSVTANPACPNEAAAERAVNEVWESCFNDTRPFDEIY
ncbi:metalloprotease ATP23 [Crassisporium funariophilum]|nr:metalloprotease ATP23 [Crassisporium funariophilum]